MNLKEMMFDSLKENWQECTACDIGDYAKHHVFGRGHMRPQVVFIGEGPGRMEDVDGVPFVGQAGRLLAEAIKRSGPKPEGGKDAPYPVRAYFTNLVACRPCDKIGGPNRAPTEQEISNCSARLEKTVQILAPRVVVLLGRVPQGALQNVPWVKNYRVFQLEHPAYVLRQGGINSAYFEGYVKRMKEVVNACLQPA